jgi:hypothetical protein
MSNLLLMLSLVSCITFGSSTLYFGNVNYIIPDG